MQHGRWPLTLLAVVWLILILVGCCFWLWVTLN